MLQGQKAGRECLTPRENAAIIPPPDVVPEQEKEKNRQLISLQFLAVSAIAAVIWATGRRRKKRSRCGVGEGFQYSIAC